MKRQSTIDTRRQIFEEAAAIIEREYARELDLDSVARRVAASSRQLQRVFSEVGGTSFRAYLAEVRMRHAAELLHRGDGAVRDVASSVGYRHRAQFTKAFRRHHGAPPSSMRNGHSRSGDGLELRAGGQAVTVESPSAGCSAVRGAEPREARMTLGCHSASERQRRNPT